jgi:hypothetical protein
MNPITEWNPASSHVTVRMLAELCVATIYQYVNTHVARSVGI